MRLSIVLPSFSLNSLFRPNEANISYVYLLVYLSIYNTLGFRVLVSVLVFLFLSLSLSPLVSHLKTPRGSERALSRIRN